MGLSIAGSTGNINQVGRDGNLRFNIHGPDIGTLGSYSLQAVSGSIAATLGAASTVFSCQWTSTTALCVVEKIAIYASTLTTITTQVHVNFAAYFARAYTVADTGGTSLVPSTTKYRRRTSFPVSLFSAGDIQIANTGTITAGTQTLDTAPFSVPCYGSSGTTAPVSWFGKGPSVVLYDCAGGSKYPIVLAANEGFVIRNIQAGAATGTWNLTVLFEWSEVTEY